MTARELAATIGYLCTRLWSQLRRFGTYLVTEPEREPVTPAAIAAHPSVKAAMTGPLPADGKPLSDEEERILGRVEMDALIGIPEPRNGSDR